MGNDDHFFNSQSELQKGFAGKGYITQVVNGKPVKIPTSQVNIIPPTAGTAAVTPKKK